MVQDTALLSSSSTLSGSPSLAVQKSSFSNVFENENFSLEVEIESETSSTGSSNKINDSGNWSNQEQQAKEHSTDDVSGNSDEDSGEISEKESDNDEPGRFGLMPFIAVTFENISNDGIVNCPLPAFNELVKMIRNKSGELLEVIDNPKNDFSEIFCERLANAIWQIFHTKSLLFCLVN